MIRVVAGTDHDDTDEPAPRVDLADRLIRHAHQVASVLEDGVTAFFIVGVQPDGRYSCGWGVDPDSPSIGSTLLGAYVATIAQREIVTQSEVVSVLNRVNGVDDASDDDGA